MWTRCCAIPRGRLARGGSILGFLTFIGLSACQPYEYQETIAAAPTIGEFPMLSRIQGVPFYPQSNLQCGPASLASLLTYLGLLKTPEDISRNIYSPRLGGSLPMDMERFAREVVSEHGWTVTVLRDDPGLFRREIIAGRPLVVFLDLGYGVWRKGHFAVLVGYDDHRQQVVAHSGRTRESIIPYSRWMRQWSRTNYWALRIVPNETGRSTSP